MNDPELRHLSVSYGTHKRGTLALAKVPKEFWEDLNFKPLDQSMKILLGDFSREMSGEASKYLEGYSEHAELLEPYD